MDEITRRTALAGIPAAGLAALLSSPTMFEAAEDKPTNPTELVVVGPYSIADWFDKCDAPLDGVFNLGVPKKKEIVKSFRECDAYIIDHTVRTKDGKIEFATEKGFWPRLFLSGKLHHHWKTKTTEFTIQIATMSCIDNRTRNSETPCTRSTKCVVTIETAGNNLLAKSTSRFHFNSEDTIKYDTCGKKL